MKKRIYLDLADPILAQCVREQLIAGGLYELAAAEQTGGSDAADLAITDSSRSTEIPHLVLGRSATNATGTVSLPVPLRLGAVTDQVRYMLSGRSRLSFHGSSAIPLGNFMLHPAESRLVQQSTGAEIRLTDKERLFLMTLREAPGNRLDRKTLLESVWGYAESAETHTLETHLYRLRQKLESCGGGDLIVSGDGHYQLKI